MEDLRSEELTKLVLIEHEMELNMIGLELIGINGDYIRNRLSLEVK